MRDHVSRETVHGEWPVGGNEKGSGKHAQMHSTRSSEHLKYVNDAKCERQSGEWAVSEGTRICSPVYESQNAGQP